MAFISRRAVNIISCIVLVAAFNVQASDDDYLKMLEAEAEDSHIDNSGQANRRVVVATSSSTVVKVKEWVGECDYISDVVPDDLASDEFSSYIKQCSPGTYAFYRRLETTKQASVYATYTRLSPTDLTVLKKEVIKYF